MKFDQLAFYCQSKEAETNIKKSFGLLDAQWVRDTVTGLSEVRGRKPLHNVAELQFNYDLGIELELIRYIEGNFWHEGDLISVPSDIPVISHFGVHLGDSEDFPVMAKNWKLVQETFTQRHTNPYVLEQKRRYHYRIYDTMNRSYVKFIRRIHE